MLDSYDFIKEWYDGYLFGNTEIYNPWSLIYSIDNGENNQPNLMSNWSNTSGNEVVYNYIKQGNQLSKSDFETLVQGRSIIKTIPPELTYRDMDEVNNIYSFLLFTGYLKIKSAIDKTEDLYELVIPNFEIRQIFKKQYTKYFTNITENYQSLLLQYLKEEKVQEANLLLNDILMGSISFYDNYESFYHGFILGVFSGPDVVSNLEAGLGRYDLGILTKNPFGTSILLAFKYSNHGNDLEADSRKALKQIHDLKYIEGLSAQGYRNIKACGISFYKKYCYLSKME